MPDPEIWPFPTTTTIAARLGRLAYGEGVRHPHCEPRPADREAFGRELGRQPTVPESTRFSIVFCRALLAMESAPTGAEVWDDEYERFVLEPFYATNGPMKGLDTRPLDGPTGKADR